MPLETLYDVNETARHLKASPWSVRRWEYLGKLKAVRAGGKVLFKESDVEKFLEAGRPAKRPRKKPAKDAKAAPAPAPGRRKPPKRANGQAKAKPQ